MKIKYLKGIKVCTVEDKLNNFVKLYDYSDVVKVLYKIFQKAEISDSSDDSESDPMRVVLTMLEEYGIKKQRISTIENKIIYDDERTLAKTKEPKFKLPKLTLKEIKLQQLLAGKKVAADKIKTLENKLSAAEAQIKALTHDKKNVQDLPQTANTPAFLKKHGLKIIPGGKMIQ